MAHERITSQDVAKAAGVSQSAVSRVFTPGASASPQTVEKVKQAAEALGYRPNILARSLITGKSRIIGLVVAYLNNQFYPEALEKLSKALQERGYHVMVFMASNNDTKLGHVLHEILDYQVDGIVAASVSLSSDFASQCKQAGVPIVLFNRSQDDAQLTTVTSDNRSGGRKVAEFLVAGGHKRIGYIAGWSGASTQMEREEAFAERLGELGHTIAVRTEGLFDEDKTRQAARDMFARTDRPDAVFVANDHMAFLTMDVLRHELGLRVPEDVSVVGYDDVPLASWPAYSLTTVRQSANRMVEETIATLLNQIRTKDAPPKRVEIDGPLILRGSARIPKGWTE